MNINIYEDYKINHKAEYNRLSEEDRNEFVKENIDEAMNHLVVDFCI